MIAIGLIFCFAGNALINVILFTTGSIISFAVLSYLTFGTLEKFNKSPSDTVQWAVIGTCAAASLLVGALINSIRKLGIACVASWGGFTLGLLITTTFVV